jgi:hypothetical protein
MAGPFRNIAHDRIMRAAPAAGSNHTRVTANEYICVAVRCCPPDHHIGGRITR